MLVLISERERRKAHFYVYCSSPCKGMQQGKLRVRCSSCRSGAFTVDRDPQCWADVLQRHRITGTCEDEVCQVREILIQQCYTEPNVAKTIILFVASFRSLILMDLNLQSFI